MDGHFIHVAALLVLLFQYATLDDNVSRCPDNLIRNKYLHAYREKCYEFITYRENYWMEAKKECVHRGGKLVTIDDIETQTFLENTLQDLHFHGTGLWIGLNDMRQEGSYQWISGAPVQYTNWARGEPSLLHDFEDCIIMERNKGFRWADRPCDLPLNHFEYICEYDKLLVSTTRSTKNTPSTTATKTTVKPTILVQETTKPTEPEVTLGKTKAAAVAGSTKHNPTTDMTTPPIVAVTTKQITTKDVTNAPNVAVNTKHFAATDITTPPTAVVTATPPVETVTHEAATPAKTRASTHFVSQQKERTTTKA